MRTKEEENGEVLKQKGKKRKQDSSGLHVMESSAAKRRSGNIQDSPAKEESPTSTPQNEPVVDTSTQNEPVVDTNSRETSEPKHDETASTNDKIELMETEPTTSSGPSGSEQDLPPVDGDQTDSSMQDLTPGGESSSQQEDIQQEVTTDETAEVKDDATVEVTTDTIPESQTEETVENCGGMAENVVTTFESTSEQVEGTAARVEGDTEEGEGHTRETVEADVVSGAEPEKSVEKDEEVKIEEGPLDHSLAADSKPKVGWQPSRGLYESVRFMFEGGICSDVMFRVGPEHGTTMDFKCHRNILAVRSEFFYNLFYKDDTKVDVHRVTDVSPQAFQVVLRYLYCDDIDRRRTAEEDLEILHAAQKYHLPRLTKSLAPSLEKKMTTNNVLTILAWSLENDQRVGGGGDGSGKTALTEACTNYIEDMTTEVFESQAFLEVSSDVLLMLLKQEGLTAAEIDIFRRCVAWAQAECQRCGLEPKAANQRQVLGEILKQFNFNVLIMAGFEDEVVKSGLLDEDELRGKQASGGE